MGVASTRKVDWGLLDKWAVHVGGGLTHRLSREDALMMRIARFSHHELAMRPRMRSWPD